MGTRTRTHVVAVGAALAGLVLAGCANPTTPHPTPAPEDSLARVQGVAAKVTEAGSARFSMTVRMIFAGEQVAATTATTVGVYDYAAHKAAWTRPSKMRASHSGSPVTRSRSTRPSRPPASRRSSAACSRTWALPFPGRPMSGSTTRAA